jgi:hypothetical protein
VTIHRNYGLFISLAIHLVIFMIPVSVVVSRHFKEVELFVIDDRPIQPLEKRMVQPKTKEMQKEIIKEAQPVITEHKITEAQATEITEPVVVSSTKNEVPLPPQIAPVLLSPIIPDSPKPAPIPIPSNKTEIAPPKPLQDVEFGSDNVPKFLHWKKIW